MIIKLENVTTGLHTFVVNQKTPIFVYAATNHTEKSIAIKAPIGDPMWITFKSTEDRNKALEVIDTALTYDPTNPAHSAHFV